MTYDSALLRFTLGANVEEGQAAQSRADFISKYSISRKEARETHYWLRLLVESQIVSPTQIDGLLTESNELIAILTSIIKRAEKKDEVIRTKLDG